MTSTAHLSDDDAAVAADAMQAAYFRGTLAEERDQIAAHLATTRAELARCREAAATAHLRSEVRSMEAEVTYLDELIAGLDLRFTGGWPPRD